MNGVSPADDGRWIVVDGRRWRATDPSIPSGLRQELVNELMAARRAVGAARRQDDGEREAAARARVDQVKRALGERGEPWWQPTDKGRRERLMATVRTLATARAPKTTCPSDAARVVGGERWRALMDPTRDVIRELARCGEVEVLQRGEAVDPDAEWRGPIRVRSATRPLRPVAARSPDVSPRKRALR